MSETVTTERMATGGEAVAHLDDGCVVFVRGALPHERVRIEVTERRKRFARARLVEVVDQSADRVPPTCAHATDDCGGCDWLFVTPDAQRRLKANLVEEQLRRLGGIERPTVRHRPERGGTRTTVRCAVTDGRAGYRARRGHNTFAAVSCQAAHATLEELIVGGRFAGIDEVVLRCAPTTGERLAWADGADQETLEGLELPADVRRVAAGDDDGLRHVIAGREFHVSPGSFFQTSDRGAEALVAAVADALQEGRGPVVDLYGGVGLLGGTTAADRLHTVVESNPTACRDAARNLGDEVEIATSRVERWTPQRAFPTVIADPSRKGLGAEGVAVVDACSAERLVLVSCDPAAMGRDVGLLRAGGWHAVETEVVDMFPDTSRIEAVTRLER